MTEPSAENVGGVGTRYGGRKRLAIISRAILLPRDERIRSTHSPSEVSGSKNLSIGCRLLTYALIILGFFRISRGILSKIKNYL